MKNYNFMIDGQTFFDQPVKNNLKTYHSTRKIATGQEDDHITGCLLDYNYFKGYCNMITVYLSKQLALDTDPKKMQQISFTRNLEKSAAVFFIIKEAKEAIVHFSQGTVRVFQVYSFLI